MVLRFWPTPGVLRGRTVQYWRATKRPPARDVEGSPSLRRDLLSFGSRFGEPVTAPHVVPTWPLGWTVGSIGGVALTVGDRTPEAVGAIHL